VTGNARPRHTSAFILRCCGSRASAGGHRPSAVRRTTCPAPQHSSRKSLLLVFFLYGRLHPSPGVNACCPVWQINKGLSVENVFLVYYRKCELEMNKRRLKSTSYHQYNYNVKRIKHLKTPVIFSYIGFLSGFQMKFFRKNHFTVKEREVRHSVTDVSD